MQQCVSDAVVDIFDADFITDLLTTLAMAGFPTSISIWRNCGKSDHLAH